MVGRIRKVLSFQAKASAVGIELSALASYGAIQEVPAVELDSWLCRQHLEDSPALGFQDLGGSL